MKPKKKIRVKPVEGRRIMLHDNPTIAITAERTVVDHAHYRRAIARGDLAIASEASAAPTDDKASGKKGK